MCLSEILTISVQGRCQGKSLGGEGTSGVQGAEPFGGGQGAKPPEAEAFLVLKLW